MSGILLAKKDSGNQAVNINPTYGIDIKITSHGSDWLWTCFCIYGCFSVYYAFKLLHKQWKYKKSHEVEIEVENKIAIPEKIDRSKNDYDYTFMLIYSFNLWITAVMSYSYFTMASNLGSTGIQTEFKHVSTGDEVFGGIRQIFYTKFIAWFLSYPVLILLLAIHNAGVLLINLRLGKFIFNYILESTLVEFYVIGLLIGSLIHSDYKWGYWTFSCFAGLLYLYFFNVFNCQASKFNKLYNYDVQEGKCKKIKLTYVNIFHQLIFLLYFISWSLGDGGNVIQPDSDTVFFGILDLCNFCFIPFALTYFTVPNIFENFTLCSTSKCLAGCNTKYNTVNNVSNAKNEKIAESGKTAVAASYSPENEDNIVADNDEEVIRESFEIPEESQQDITHSV